jgi:hypothetical protein
MARKTDVGHPFSDKNVLQQDLPLSGFLFLKNSIAFVDKTYHQFVRHKYCFHILYTEYNKKESLWIKKLKTFEPLGLNIKLDRH